MRKKKDNIRIAKDILVTLLEIGGILALTIMAPNALQLLKYFSNKKYKKEAFYKTYYYMKKKGYFEIKSNQNGSQLILTPKGKSLAFRYQIEDLKLKKPKRWDKKWRIVIFDIP